MQYHYYKIRCKLCPSSKARKMMMHIVCVNIISQLLLFFKLYAFILLTSTLVPGINYLYSTDRVANEEDEF